MAYLDLHEQERVDNIKYLWKKWGKYILILVGILIVSYIISSIYSWYQQKEGQKAAIIYANFQDSLKNNDNKTISIAKEMIVAVPHAEYTSMAGIEAAKLAFNNKNYSDATKLLDWVRTNSPDKSLQSIAILRQASIYTDQKQFIQARNLLRTKHDLAFDGLFYEGRGDVYIAMGDVIKARDAYKEGLHKAANDPNTSQNIQMKLDVIGG